MVDIRERMWGKLTEQIGFIRASCQAYDAGSESEALRIATCLRTILHDSSRGGPNPSVSLMSHLGLKNGSMLSSSRGIGDREDFISYRFSLDKANPASMIPILGDKFHEISINDWWNKETVIKRAENPVTRRRLVLDAANKDGGTHVDQSLPNYYALLNEGDQSIGISISGLKDKVGWVKFEEDKTHFATNSHLALIRQFGHEFLASATHFQWVKEV